MKTGPGTSAAQTTDDRTTFTKLSLKVVRSHYSKFNNLQVLRTTTDDFLMQGWKTFSVLYWKIIRVVRSSVAAALVEPQVWQVWQRRGRSRSSARTRTGAGQNFPQSQIYVLKWSRLGRGKSQPDLRPVGDRGQQFASHQLYRWPVLAEDAICIVVIARFNSNAAGFPAAAALFESEN